MSLTGMDLAFGHAGSHAVADDCDVLVAPARVVTVLKMAAYCDRPAERERDLEDIANLLDAYIDDDSDRRFDEAAGQDFELAPAYLLGLDVGRVAQTEAHQELIGRFLGRVVDPESIGHALMRSSGPANWRSEDALERRLNAFGAGLAAGSRQ